MKNLLLALLIFLQCHRLLWGTQATVDFDSLSSSKDASDRQSLFFTHALEIQKIETLLKGQRGMFQHELYPLIERVSSQLKILAAHKAEYSLLKHSTAFSSLMASRVFTPWQCLCVCNR